MRPSLHHTPEARVVVLLTDPTNYAKKELVQLTAFEQISSSLSLDGVGSATVSFVNKQLIFQRGIQWPTADMQVADEIAQLKAACIKFDGETNAPISTIPMKYFSMDKFLYPRVNTLDMIWIDYRGRDGYWYPGFTGVVTGIDDSMRAAGTPIFNIRARDFRRLLQTTPIVTGLNYMAEGAYPDATTILTKSQTASYAITNIFAGTNAAQVLDNTLVIVNNMLNITPKDGKSFWRYRTPRDLDKKISEIENDTYLFAGGFSDTGAGGLSGFSYSRAIDEYNYNAMEFGFSKGRQLPDPPVSTYYRNPFGWAFHDTVFRATPSVYQMMVRSQLEMFALNYETAMSILNRIAQVTQSFIYVDQSGNLRYEYPRYGSLPSRSDDPSYPGRIDGVDDVDTPYHALNYWISSADEAFLDYKFSENESELVATHVTARQELVLSQVQQYMQKELTEALTGFASAPEDDILKYGLRNADAVSFMSNVVVNSDIMTAYAEAFRIILASRKSNFTVSLSNRADTMLNRTMVYMDRGLVGLITDISDTFSVRAGHTRTHTCRYVRQVGQRLEFPLRLLLEESSDSHAANLPVYA